MHHELHQDIGHAPVLARCLDGLPEIPDAPPWAQWLTVAHRSRPMPGFARSGDAWLLHWADLTLTVAVIDGLGHGDHASDAASLAVRTIEDGLAHDPTSALDRLMLACHRALTASRGAAIALLRVDVKRKLEAFCGVGNITFTGSPWRHNRGVSFAGTVGHTMRTARVFEVPSDLGDVLVLHTDGIRSSFCITDTSTPDELVASAVGDFGRAGDDQVIVAVRVDSLPLQSGG